MFLVCRCLVSHVDTYFCLLKWHHVSERSEWLYYRPTALRIIDENDDDDDMSDDAMDVGGIQHGALCEDLLCRI